MCILSHRIFVFGYCLVQMISQIRELKRQDAFLSLQFFINIYKELILVCSLSILSFAMLKFRINFYSNEIPACVEAGDSCGTAAHKTIQYHCAGIAADAD